MRFELTGWGSPGLAGVLGGEGGTRVEWIFNYLPIMIFMAVNILFYLLLLDKEGPLAPGLRVVTVK